MAKYCVMCGLPIPDDQGSSSCSMCYGDIDHGKDWYYREWAERFPDGSAQEAALAALECKP